MLFLITELIITENVVKIFEWNLHLCLKNQITREQFAQLADLEFP